MAVQDTWPQYVRRVTGSLTQAQIAAKVGGVSTSNIGRWLRGEPGLPSAENVITFAKAFNRPPMEALCAAGYFTAEEADMKSRTPIAEFTTAELFDELRRRTIN